MKIEDIVLLAQPITLFFNHFWTARLMYPTKKSRIISELQICRNLKIFSEIRDEVGKWLKNGYSSRGTNRRLHGTVRWRELFVDAFKKDRRKAKGVCEIGTI